MMGKLVELRHAIPNQKQTSNAGVVTSEHDISFDEGNNTTTTANLETSAADQKSDKLDTI